MFKITAKWNSNFFIIFLLFLVVGFLQYFLLGLVLEYGFTPDDWRLLSFYKTLGSDPFSKVAYVWSIKGAYTTSQVYFIGILNSFFGLNYQNYHVVNIIIKLLATVSMYPLILVIFKRKLLAFLVTTIYGMSYMGTRSLEYVVKGTDYLAIIPLNIFFVIYYFVVIRKVKRWWWFMLMTFFWFLALIISPIRIYPILFLIPLIELFLCIQDYSINKILSSLKRLLILYLPLLVVYFYKQDAVTVFLQSPHMIFQAILRGNLHIILTPFQGLGLTWFSVTEWNNIFNSMDMSSFKNYLIFLFNPFRGPLFISGIVSLFLSLIIFKRKLYSYIVIFSSISLLSIIFYYIVIYGLEIPEIFKYPFDINKMYSILIAGFVLCIALAAFLEWRVFMKNNTLLFALWITPPIALLYIFLIWLLAPFGVSFENRQGYYLVIPAMPASLFISAFLVAIYDKATEQKNRLFQIIMIFIFFAILFNLLFLNGKNINFYFSNAKEDGRFAKDQEMINISFLQYIKEFNYKQNNLVYIDSIEDNLHSNYYYEQALIESLPSRFLFNNINLEQGCVAIFYQGIDNLSKITVFTNEIKGFIYTGQCNKNAKITENILYPIDNFYAFKIKNGEIVSIKQETLNKLISLLRLNK